MSRYYSNYPQYLGSQRCCDLRGQGPPGPQGPTGPSAVGQMGPTGAPGQSITGPTGRGCRGPTGEPGPSVLPLTNNTSGTNNTVVYDPVGNALYYNSSKTFVIDHPVYQDKYLVHACLEGPEAGVYYRGMGEIIDDDKTTIILPDYVCKFAKDFTIQITPIYNGKIITLNASEIIDNEFTVYGEQCKFYWNVYGKRFDIDVEPNKNDVEVRGQGPYLYF